MSGQQAITTAVYVAKGGSRYHAVQGCVVLGRCNAPQVVVVSLRKAENANKTPCRMCCNRS